MNGGRRRRIEGGAGFQKADDLAAAHAGALYDGVDTFGGGPLQLHQIGQRDAGNGGIAYQRHHAVAMAAEDKSGDVFDGNLEFLRQEKPEARRIENTGHADHLVVGQSAGVAQDHNHNVQRIGDADDEGFRAVFLDALADRLHDFGIDAQQVVAAHARLAGDSGGDDDHVGAADGAIAFGSFNAGVEAFDGCRFRNIQGLALWNSADDVEQDDIAQFL